jgi:hypothetical protein
MGGVGWVIRYGGTVGMDMIGLDSEYINSVFYSLQK